jgi:hypothetical protein
MTSPNTKSSLAVIIAVAGLLLTGWASAAVTAPITAHVDAEHMQSLNVPAGSVCKVVKTTFETDSKGRTVITTKKVCEVAK